VAILDALYSNQKIQKQESPCLILAIALNLPILIEPSKIFGCFASKKIKEDRDCVIMQWNVMGITGGHRNETITNN
jgi:hypothetical protein